MAVASPLSYEDNLAKKLIRAFKYQGLISLANPFGQILNQVIDEYQEVFQKEQ
jgi:predicted amidophosphoribosyltransferase